MLELGSLGEFFIILIAALVLIGPREMPALLRTLGRWTQKIQTLSANIRQGLDHYIQEGKFEEVQKSKNQSMIQSIQKQNKNSQKISSPSKRGHGNV